MSKIKGLSSERIAKRLLERRGFKILFSNFSIMDDKEKVAEVDFIAEDPNGKKYAVEVKAGNGDVNSIRQTYANAKLCEYNPLLICKGFSDEGARKAALKLKVDVIELSEYYLLLQPEELENIIKKCVEEVFETHGFLPYSIEIDKNDQEILKTISTSDNFDEASEKLDLNKDDLGKKIRNLTKKGILPNRSLSYKDLKRCSSSILSRNEILFKINKIEKILNKYIIDN
jgi:predicted RecB family endonuclease